MNSQCGRENIIPLLDIKLNFFLDCKFDASYQPVNIRVNGPVYKYIHCKIQSDQEELIKLISYTNRYCLQCFWIKF